MINLTKSKFALIRGFETHPELLIKEQKHLLRKKKSSMMNELFMYYKLRSSLEDVFTQICGFQIILQKNVKELELSNLEQEVPEEIEFHQIIKDVRNFQSIFYFVKNEI